MFLFKIKLWFCSWFDSVVMMHREVSKHRYWIPVHRHQSTLGFFFHFWVRWSGLLGKVQPLLSLGAILSVAHSDEFCVPSELLTLCSIQLSLSFLGLVMLWSRHWSESLLIDTSGSLVGRNDEMLICNGTLMVLNLFFLTVD